MTLVEPETSPSRVGQLTARFRGDQLGRDTAWGTVQEVVNLLVTLAAFSMLSRSLGPSGYGSYASLYAIIAPLGTLAASGMCLSLMQHIVRDREDVGETTRSCLAITLVIGSLLTVVGLLIGNVVIENLAVASMVGIMLMELVAYPAVQIGATTVHAVDGYTAATRLRLIPSFLRAGILVVLFRLDALDIATYGLAQLVVFTLLAFWVLRLVAQRYEVSVRPGRIRKAHLKTSAVYAGGISGLSLQNDGDKMVLAANRLTVDTGLYAAAYRIVQFGLVPLFTLISVTHNRFLRHEEGKKRQHLDRSIQFTLVTVVYGVIVVLFLVVVAPLLPRLLGENFEGSVEMVRWLAPLVLLRGLATFPLNGLMGLGRTGLRTWLLIGSAALSMAMYIALVPRIGWKGAALGTVVGEAVLAIVVWVLLVHYQRVDDRRDAEDPLGVDGAGMAGPTEGSPL